MKEFDIHAGVVIGRNHLLEGLNCQDALQYQRFEYEGRQYLVGVIADGCGEGKHSEVGAQLAVQFIPIAVREWLRNGVLLEDIPALLYEKVLHFLYELVGGLGFRDRDEQVGFIRENLLFTVLGFIITPEDTLIFAAGDGIVLVNEDVYIRDQQNTPAYIGYQLLERDRLHKNVTALPVSFELYRMPTIGLQRLAIGSDAWEQEQELLHEVWGIPSRAGLQLRLNRWSNAKKLKDDASLIVVEQRKETGAY